MPRVKKLDSLGEVRSPRPTNRGAGGWANEFNTIRPRLTAFAEANPALNLGDIATLRFDVGPDHGSAVGRVAIDDVLLEY